jgi:hypothetical protein
MNNTKMCSCSDQPALARASWLAPWHKKPAAMGIPHSTPAPRPYSVTLRWRGPTAACAVCCRGLAASTIERLGHGTVESERRDFWEICGHRYQVRSTIRFVNVPTTNK